MGGQLTSMTDDLTLKMDQNTNDIIDQIKKGTYQSVEVIEKALRIVVDSGKEQTKRIIK